MLYSDSVDWESETVSYQSQVLVREMNQYPRLLQISSVVSH